MRRFKGMAMTVMMGGVIAVAAGCGSDDTKTSSGEGKGSGQLQGEVITDGSSTVFPIMEAVAEEYMATQPDVKVSVGSSGTGGGFKKFIAGDTDLANASRPVKEEETALLDEKGVKYTELKLAFDGISIVANKDNEFIDSLTVEELQKLWIDNGKVKKWSDIRPEWPNEEIKFYSPGTDSGTYDYFNEVILEEKPMVENATLSEDDNVLVQGVEGDKNAIGFFGYAYYSENKDKLKIISIDNGKGAVEPTHETIKSGEYAPLSRPLYTYVANKSVAEKEQVADYTQFVIENAGELAEEVGYISLPEEEYQKDLDKLKELEK
ncbi:MULTISPECIES: PstS family phosphate ABC transporter substrate-binding protein [Bacillaceae]|jgi:phosphate transport system substrate-binding protein|uniref:PstS family phosphate ABC transporter substrate-binding protein n=1 Tax=Bacillaceae TaxID=186817 RepID=UPI000C31F60A|nr:MULTISPECIES: PstS family phosphate ABC transporter substrate-binding protein [Bacillaceae]MCT4480227.1 PstS family phosphate ABC transporter substrate-binding protein [Peribacillus frigoritolerans]PKF88930.1 phosphate-binding protein [Bacillus sp. BA3]CAH0228528.1 Phosphate-binding protein PstS [Peribacillus sp. Bi134]